MLINICSRRGINGRFVNRIHTKVKDLKKEPGELDCQLAAKCSFFFILIGAPDMLILYYYKNQHILAVYGGIYS